MVREDGWIVKGKGQIFIWCGVRKKVSCIGQVLSGRRHCLFFANTITLSEIG
jgi:hypothetical protein